MSGGSRMDDKRLHICHVCQKREQLQIITELLGCLLAALDLEGEDGTASVREIFLIQCLLLRIGGYGRMMHALYLRMIVQILYNLQCILHMTLHAQRQCLQSL